MIINRIEEFDSSSNEGTYVVTDSKYEISCFGHMLNYQIGDARVIALAEAFELDASISQVAGMPCGCFAERESAASDWRIFSRQ